MPYAAPDLGGCAWTPSTLSDLADGFAASLDLRITEVRTEDDIDEVLRQVTPVQQVVIGDLKTEFAGTRTLLPFVAWTASPGTESFGRSSTARNGMNIVGTGASGTKSSTVFSMANSWPLPSAGQASIVPEPAEALVDRVAAILAFYPDMFEPIVMEEYAREGRLTFDVIDSVRERIAPDASREAAVNACLRHIPSPVWFLQCRVGLKASERRRLNSPQTSFFPEEAP